MANCKYPGFNKLEENSPLFLSLPLCDLLRELIGERDYAQSDKNNPNQPESLNFWRFWACRPSKVNTLRRPPHPKSPKN